jgi:hypothetical protein
VGDRLGYHLGREDSHDQRELSTTQYQRQARMQRYTMSASGKNSASYDVSIRQELSTTQHQRQTRTQQQVEILAGPPLSYPKGITGAVYNLPAYERKFVYSLFSTPICLIE